MNRPAALFLAMAAALLPAGCEFAASGGNGSETTNQLSGVVKDPSGNPVGGISVAAVPRDHDPLSARLASANLVTTDARGRFRFPDSIRGEFNLEFADGAGSLRAWRGGVRDRGNASPLGDITLDEPGALRVNLPAVLAKAGGHIVLPGTTFHQAITESAYLLFEGLPGMRIPSVAYARRAGAPLYRLLADVPVTSGRATESSVPDSVVLPGEAVFAISTLPSGAAIAEEVRDFPLLLRLDSANFDFSLTPEERARLHFRDARGALLAHEVERWDSAGGRAEIWIHLDSVAGNSADQSIRMVWAYAAKEPAGLPVFAPERGFDAVFHFGGGGAFRRNASDSLRPGMILRAEGDEGAEGLIGPADSLDAFREEGSPDAVNDIFEAGRFPLLEALTLSAWVRIRELPATIDPILSHEGDSLDPTWFYALSLGSDTIAPSIQLGGKEGRLNSPQAIAAGANPIIPGEWVLVQGTFDGERLDAYVNGRLVSSVSATHPGSPGLDDGTTYFGFGAGGMADELRIERRARSAAWLRLSYENQKAGQGLVKRTR